ncbi:MAG: hypothetical protein ACOY35_11480 [Bacillota bacterium]
MMPDTNPKGKRKIVSAKRNKGGEIIGFQLEDHGFMDYQGALSEAKAGKLAGINLYPSFVKDVISQGKQNGLLKRLRNLLFGSK